MTAGPSSFTTAVGIDHPIVQAPMARALPAAQLVQTLVDELDAIAAHR